MFDRLKATIVKFSYDETGKIWLNVDGICVARIDRVNTIKVDAPGFILAFNAPTDDQPESDYIDEDDLC